MEIRDTLELRDLVLIAARGIFGVLLLDSFYNSNLSSYSAVMCMLITYIEMLTIARTTTD